MNGVGLDHARAHDNIRIGDGLSLPAAACLPRANDNHHITNQLLRAGIQLGSAGDTLLIHLFTDILIGSAGQRLGKNERVATQER